MQLCPAKENAFAAQPCGCVLDVGVSLDDHRRRVPELEVHALARCALADAPADLPRPRERDQSDALVLDEDVADLARGADEHVEPARREAGVVLELGEKQGGERGLRRGLEHHGATGREGRARSCGPRG